ncbi:MAG: hypothetical protein ACK56I_09270, partial [bacterium]
DHLDLRLPDLVLGVGEIERDPRRIGDRETTRLRRRRVLHADAQHRAGPLRDAGDALDGIGRLSLGLRGLRRSVRGGGRRGGRDRGHGGRGGGRRRRVGRWGGRGGGPRGGGR